METKQPEAMATGAEATKSQALPLESLRLETSEKAHNNDQGCEQLKLGEHEAVPGLQADHLCKERLIDSIQPLPDDSEGVDATRLTVAKSCRGQVGAHAIHTFHPDNPSNHQGTPPISPLPTPVDVEQGEVVVTAHTLVQARLVEDEHDAADMDGIVVKAENIQDKSMSTCRAVQILAAIAVVALLVIVIVVLLTREDDDNGGDPFDEYLANMDDEYKNHHYENFHDHSRGQHSDD